MPVRPKHSETIGTGVGTSGKADEIKVPRPIVFWSDNERDAFRRNRVVQTRCRMILDEINTQRETSKRAIRYEAHKFRKKSEKFLRHSESKKRSDCPREYQYNSLCRLTDKSRSCYVRVDSSSSEDKDSQEDSNDKEDSQFPKMTGIITRARKPSVRFVVSDDEHDGSMELRLPEAKEKSDRPTSEKQRNISTDFGAKPFIKRSLSAVCLRENPEDSSLLRRQKSVVMSFQTNAEYITDSKTIGKLTDIGSSPRSDTFFVKSRAAYQLRQDLKRQAILRKQGVNQKTATLSDYLKAEQDRYIHNSGKIMEYIKRIDTEKLFRPLILNKWTTADIEKQL